MYSLQQCESLITNAAMNGCNVEIIEEGVLGLGLIAINGGEDYHSYVIREVYISSWSSGHTIRKYKKLPKKYQ